jgi:tape measure domain-containing protein
MADNNTDVSLRVTATTDGADSIQKLAADVRNLAKEGGDAAPQFEKLVQELDNLAGQAGAVQNLSDLQSHVAQLTEQQKAAAESAQQLGNELKAVSEKTEGYSAAEAKAKDEVREAQRVIADKRDALARLKLEYEDTGKQTEKYRHEVQRMSVAILDAKQTLREKKDALLSAQQATRDAAEAEKALAAQSKFAGAEIQATARELTRQTATLNEAQDTVRQLGIATEDLAKAQAQIREAFAATARAVEEQQAALVAQREAEEQVAQAARQEAVEYERLASIQRNARYEMEAAARRQLEAERQQYTESIALAQRAADAKIAAERRYAECVEASAQARKALDDAFAQTGVRSAQSVQIEINKINNALHLLANDATVTEDQFNRAFTSAQKRVAALKNTLTQTHGDMGKTADLTALVTRGFGLMGGAYAAIQFGQKFIDANVQLESMRRSLAITTGSTQEAARAIEFLRTTADRSGIAIGDISETFMRFNTSVRLAGMSAKTAEDVFSAVARASGQMGLTSQQASLALDAIAQMADKGVVSMEELRRQLGNSLPGALKASADGLGLTVKQLTDMVEKGQVMSADMLPALAAGMTKTIAGGTQQVEGFQATWNRLKNTMTLAMQTIGDTGAMDALGTSLRAAGALAGSVALGVSVTLDTVFTGVRQAATLTAGAVHGDLKGAYEEAGRMGDEMIARQAKLARSIQELAGIGDKTAATQSSVGDASARAGVQAQAGAAGYADNAKAQQGAAAAAAGNAQSQALAGAAVQQAGGQAAGAADGWYKVGARYIEANKNAEQATQVAEKLAQAKKFEGEAVNHLAQMSGNEIETRAAASRAAQGEADALKDLAVARGREVDLLKQEYAEREAAAKAQGPIREDQAKYLKNLNDTIEKKQAEAEQSKQAAVNAENEAAARRLASAAYQDNAARLNELAQAAKVAQEQLKALEANNDGSAAALGQIANAARQAAAAEGLYRDALADTAQAAARKVESLQQDASESEIAIRAKLAHWQAEERIATAYSAAREAMEASIQQKRVEIEAINNRIAATERETQATLQQIAAQRAELQASGQLLPDKEKELELRERAAKAKLAEAQAGEENIRVLRQEIFAIDEKANTTVEASRKETSAKNESKSKAGPAVDNSGLFSLLAKQRAGTLSADDLKTAEGVFQAASGNLSTMQQLNGTGLISLEGQRSVETAYNQSRTLLEQVRALAKNDETKKQPGTQGGVRTINLNIGGRQTAVNVASEADAYNLTAVMRQLESLSGRSTL